MKYLWNWRAIRIKVILCNFKKAFASFSESKSCGTLIHSVLEHIEIKVLTLTQDYQSMKMIPIGLKSAKIEINYIDFSKTDFYVQTHLTWKWYFVTKIVLTYCEKKLF